MAGRILGVALALCAACGDEPGRTSDAAVDLAAMDLRASDLLASDLLGSCGDGACVSPESCGSCAADCGACPSSYLLEVTATSVDAMGRVSSMPAGISCTTDGTPACTASFPLSSTVILTAAPLMSVHAKFLGWNGAGCTGTGTCTVVMDGQRKVTATFACAAGQVCPF